MYLLNGVPPILGLGFFHITLINILAIALESNFLKMRFSHKRILLRTIFANLVSVIVGFIVLIWVPDFMGANIQSTEPDLDKYGRLALLAGFAGLFLANVIIEFPFQFIRSGAPAGKMFLAVLYANVISNIPVFLLYSLLMAG